MITVRKLSESDAPAYKAGTWNEYVCGQLNNNVSLPIDYEVKGYLIFPIEVGNSIFMDRRERNGVKMDGKFMSSVVTKIVDIGELGRIVETRNSIYLVS